MTQKSIDYTTLILEEPVFANGARCNHSLLDWCIENEINVGDNADAGDKVLYDLKKNSMTFRDRDKTLLCLAGVGGITVHPHLRGIEMVDFGFVIDNPNIDTESQTIVDGDIRVIKCRTTTVKNAQELVNCELETDTFSNVVKKLYRCELSFQKYN